MIRLLIEAPQAYNLPRLTAEIRKEYPDVLGVNEVEGADTRDERIRYIAVYFEDSAPETAALQAIIEGHDSAPGFAPVLIEQRITELEEALASTAHGSQSKMTLPAVLRGYQSLLKARVIMIEQVPEPYKSELEGVAE